LKPLAKWCGARFIHARAERIDFARNLVVCRRASTAPPLVPHGGVGDAGPAAGSSQTFADEVEERGEDYVPSIPYDLLAVDIGSVTKVRVSCAPACCG
jgi:hypothetical protein